MVGSRLEDQDLDADADEALEAARAMPPGPEKTEALKKAGLLRVAADARKIAFARRGRPPKTKAAIASSRRRESSDELRGRQNCAPNGGD
jgi:hypothetical protein